MQTVTISVWFWFVVCLFVCLFVCLYFLLLFFFLSILFRSFSFLLPKTDFIYFGFQSFDFEGKWWRLFRKCFVHTNLDIYVFNNSAYIYFWSSWEYRIMHQKHDMYYNIEWTSNLSFAFFIVYLASEFWACFKLFWFIIFIGVFR